VHSYRYRLVHLYPSLWVLPDTIHMDEAIPLRLTSSRTHHVVSAADKACKKAAFTPDTCVARIQVVSICIHLYPLSPSTCILFVRRHDIASTRIRGYKLLVRDTVCIRSRLKRATQDHQRRLQQLCVDCSTELSKRRCVLSATASVYTLCTEFNNCCRLPQFTYYAL